MANPLPDQEPTPNEREPDSGRSAEWEQRNAVWASSLPPKEKLVLLAFIDFDRRARGHILYPSLDLIAWQTGCAYATVKRAVERLRASGILQVTGHVSSAVSRGRVTCYRFRPASLPTRPALVSAGDRGSQRATVKADRGSQRAAVRPRQGLNPLTTGAQSARDRGSIRSRQGLTVSHKRTYDRTEERTEERTGEHVRSSDLIRTAVVIPPRCARRDSLPVENPENPDSSPDTDMAEPNEQRYLELAQQALSDAIRDDKGDDSVPNVARHFKRLCAAAGLRHDSQLVAQTLASALASRDAKKAEFFSELRRMAGRQ